MPAKPPRPSPLAHVTLRQLRAFAAAAEARSVTRAALTLSLTPSALSMLIRGLEAELGTPLFDRSGRRFEPTAAGRELQTALATVFAALEDAFERVRAAGQDQGGLVRVAASPLLAAELLPRLIADFQGEFPGIRVQLSDLGVEQVAGAVRSGRADIGVCTADADAADLTQMPLYRDRMLLACPAAHPLAARRSVRWAEVAGEPLIVLRAGSGLRALVEATLKQIGATLRIAQEVTHVSTATGLVAAGLGLTILPSHALERARAEGVVRVPLVEPAVERAVVALLAPGRTQHPATEAFSAYLRSALGPLVATARASRGAKSRV
ncbi:MAG: LysR family transcriptional regulator [Burkholderiales bacterium]|nr:LysR family transcriptional regulator [Burkholderiales bacterium]